MARARPELTDIMGRVAFKDSSGVHVASLRWDGHWEVRSRPPRREADALLAERLDDLYRESFLDSGPADGFPGYRELDAAARYLGGRAIPTDPNPGTDSAEVVY